MRLRADDEPAARDGANLIIQARGDGAQQVYTPITSRYNAAIIYITIRCHTTLFIARTAHDTLPATESRYGLITSVIV